MQRLKDRVAIITGSRQGIGKAIALAFAREGAKVVVADLSEEDCQKVVDEINGMGTEGMAAYIDVTNPDAVNEAARRTIERFGRIDILVNNAGVFPIKPLAEMSENDWDFVNNINTRGMFLCTKAVLPKMLEQRSGNIINLASIAGNEIGCAGLVHYCATKSAATGFTRCAAVELAETGIRVNAIAPGLIETPGVDSVFGKEGSANFAQNTPIKRNGRPEEIATVALFLASDESSLITGQCIIADGGYSSA